MRLPKARNSSSQSVIIVMGSCSTALLADQDTSDSRFSTPRASALCAARYIGDRSPCAAAPLSMRQPGRCSARHQPPGQQDAEAERQHGRHSMGYDEHSMGCCAHHTLTLTSGGTLDSKRTYARGLAGCSQRACQRRSCQWPSVEHRHADHGGHGRLCRVDTETVALPLNRTVKMTLARLKASMNGPSGIPCGLYGESVLQTHASNGLRCCRLRFRDRQELHRLAACPQLSTADIGPAQYCKY